eukprot:scaffold38402_cov39-Phaeocystis_antarctica.AAC.1
MNAQDYFGCSSFLYTATHLHATHTFPASGHNDGGSLTVVHLATPLAPRVLRDGRFQCRFGDGGASGAGTLVGDAGVRCLVPQADPLSALPLTLPVRLTLNGQQFTVGPADFTYYGFRLAGGLGYVVPNTVAVSPAIGPVAGGTAIAVYGAALSRGSDYSCRFGAAGENVPWLATPNPHPNHLSP